MTSIPFLTNAASAPCATLLLAHGSGLPMDSPFMTDIAEKIAAVGVTVHRFEFPYMADRRTGGAKRPPPRADKLCDDYRAAITAVRAMIPQEMLLLIGGKSLGGRVASMVANSEHEAGSVQGLVCFGYPFHPPKKPDALRTAHLMDLDCPALICQGTRDPLGTREEIETYQLPERIAFAWIADGDHDFKPRKRSGFTQEQNIQEASEAVSAFVPTVS